MNVSSWRLYKLGQPISPLEVVLNGSQAMHAVGDEGVSVDSADGATRLHIRCEQGCSWGGCLPAQGRRHAGCNQQPVRPAAGCS